MLPIVQQRAAVEIGPGGVPIAPTPSPAVNTVAAPAPVPADDLQFAPTAPAAVIPPPQVHKKPEAAAAAVATAPAVAETPPEADQEVCSL